MNAAEIAALLQLADSAFPSGSFSHSFGLETAIVENRVRDESTLEHWLRAYLLDAFATLDGAALALVVRRREDPLDLDDIVTAATNAPEVRAANRRIACSVLDTLQAMGLGSGDLERYGEALRRGRCRGVPSIAFGLAYAAVGAECEIACAAYASSSIAALAAVATRVIPLGQRSTARVLWRLRATAAEAARLAGTIACRDELRAQAFEVEIDALRHRHLDGRLFAS